MNYCGVCGAYLREHDRASGVCPLCGNALDAIAGTTAPGSRQAPAWGAPLLGGTSPAARRGWGRIVLVAVAALLVLAAASAVTLTLRGLPGGSGAPPAAHGAGGTSGTQTRAASPSTALGPSPTIGEGSTATPGASATAAPNFTVTAQPLSPHLSVGPLTINCKTTQPLVFDVSNNGGGSLNWMASPSSDTIKASPSTGSLPGGESIRVSVADTNTDGTITVTATDASGTSVSGSPQYVIVSCLGIV
ncbi:MAG TPA: hypothetical protein VIG30_03860 [Ktedonobacterales bacterium]